MNIETITAISTEFMIKIPIFDGRLRTYLDPSAVTFTIQLVVGIVVAAGAAVGIILTKLKKKAKDKLGIDLEKKKEVEEDIVEYTDQPDDADNTH